MYIEKSQEQTHLEHLMYLCIVLYRDDGAKLIQLNLLNEKMYY